MSACVKKKECHITILGNGSNLLVGDKGYHGVIIQICKEMNEISVEDNFLNVQAGALLSRVGNVALEAGLAGFEFASGIPGTDGRRCVYECRSLWRRDERHF